MLVSAAVAELTGLCVPLAEIEQLSRGTCETAATLAAGTNVLPAEPDRLGPGDGQRGGDDGGGMLADEFVPTRQHPHVPTASRIPAGTWSRPQTRHARPGQPHAPHRRADPGSHPHGVSGKAGSGGTRPVRHPGRPALRQPAPETFARNGSCPTGPPNGSLPAAPSVPPATSPAIPAPAPVVVDRTGLGPRQRPRRGRIGTRDQRRQPGAHHPGQCLPHHRSDAARRCLDRVRRPWILVDSNDAHRLG